MSFSRPLEFGLIWRVCIHTSPRAVVHVGDVRVKLGRVHLRTGKNSVVFTHRKPKYPSTIKKVLARAQCLSYGVGT